MDKIRNYISNGTNLFNILGIKETKGTKGTEGDRFKMYHELCRKMSVHRLTQKTTKSMKHFKPVPCCFKI